MDESNNVFLFHIFSPDLSEYGVEENVTVKNYSFIKMPSIPEPSKTVLYHYVEEKNELYLLERNYYNPKIESLKYETEKINKSCVSLFINNYAIQNDCSFLCYPIDALFLFISIIYENCENNTYTTLEDYLDNILKNNEKHKYEAVKNVLTIFKKNVNNVKDRLMYVCDVLHENNNFYYKPNIKKVKNFYNFRCIILYNYIIEKKIIFSDYVHYINNELLDKHKMDIHTHPFHSISKKNFKEIEKYKEYKKYIDTYIIEFNKKYYKFNGTNLRNFIWLIMKGFMCHPLCQKITPSDIHENLDKRKEEDKLKKLQQNETVGRGKKHALQTPRNQLMIDSFFKKKREK
ncbi:ribonuclease H2 subunit B, putative [Plasmodium ovale]|uniref:Ribonuclease H2 subunit B, putative n=2 Tax=Plasmodium ovale TaxID=36330 RepID=A0A1A8W699_PLAOA|nr:ribonuclease H2 subunit B, putative [Plasmodium ovale curtisi]SCP06080.1 ribonuclease H2 subunit B, putative [Plasmodium ovale]